MLTSRAGPPGAWKHKGRKDRRQDGGTAIKSTVRDDPATSGRGGKEDGLQNRRSDKRVSIRATGGHTRIAALSGYFRNGVLLCKSKRATLTRREAWTAPAPLSPPTAPSWAQRPRATTTGVERPRDDPWVILPERRLLLRRPVGLPSTGAVRGALRGGVKACPVGVARRRRAAAATVPAAAPFFSPPYVSPASATWLYVPPCALAALESAGVPGVDASPCTPPPGRPGYCTHVPGTDRMWKSPISAFLHMKPIDLVHTNSGCGASPPDQAEWERRRKLCEGTTPLAWLLKKDRERSEQGKPILVGPTSVLASPPPQKAS